MTLLKTPHTLVSGYRLIKLELIWKLPSYWLAFVVPEGVMQSTKEIASVIVLNFEPHAL